MSTLKAKFRTAKIGLNILLSAALIIILAQNIQPVDMHILFWEVHVPLVVLLLGTAILSALIVFISIIIIGGRNT